MSQQGKRNKFSDPLLDEGIRGWIVQYAKKNRWRVPSYLELRDLVQDGYFCFAYVRKIHPEVTNSKHLMCLLKPVYANFITDLANARTPLVPNPDKTSPETHIRQQETLTFSQVMPSNISEEHVLEGIMGSEDELGSVMALAASAPGELKQLMDLFMSDFGKIQLNRPSRSFLSKRETTNQRICRILGLDPAQVNLSAMFKAHFMGIGEIEAPPNWEGFLCATAKAAHEMLEGDSMVEQA